LAQVADDTFLTQRLARQTSVTPVQNKPMVGMTLVLYGNDLFQFGFNLERRLAGSQTGAIADTEDVGVDRDRRLAESNVEHDIGGLAPNTRQCLQCFPRARHLPSVLGQKLPRQCDDIFCLGAEKADGFDQLAHALFAKRRHLFRRIGKREKRGRRLVHARIGRLCGEHDRD